MNKLVVYRILSYFLIIIAALLGFACCDGRTAAARSSIATSAAAATRQARSSFVQQLHSYGFHKRSLDRGRTLLEHEYFRRDEPDLLGRIQRRRRLPDLPGAARAGGAWSDDDGGTDEEVEVLSVTSPAPSSSPSWLSSRSSFGDPHREDLVKSLTACKEDLISKYVDCILKVFKNPELAVVCLSCVRVCLRVW